MSIERLSVVAAVEGLATQVATQPRSLVRSLEIGLICAMVAVAGRAGLDPLLGEHLPFSLFFPALLAAALFGGAPAAALALAFTTVSGWFLFLPPKLSFDIATGRALQIPVFLAVGLFTAGTGLVLRGALMRLETHRRRHETLVFELNERLRKDLDRVAAIARESLRDSSQQQRSGEALVDRLTVLRGAHTDLSRLDWGPISLRRMVARPLCHFAPTEAARIAVEGPDVNLDPDLAVSLALCVWELANHARRVGALAIPDGRVRISWMVEAGLVTFNWIETDVGAESTIRDLARRLAGDRLAWRRDSVAGVVQWTVRLEGRPAARSVHDAPQRTAEAA